MRMAGEDEDGADVEGEESTATAAAAAVAVADAATLIALEDCGWPASGAAARTIAGLFSIRSTAGRARGTAGLWRARRRLGGTTFAFDSEEQLLRRMPVHAVFAGNICVSNRSSSRLLWKEPRYPEL